MTRENARSTGMSLAKARSSVPRRLSLHSINIRNHPAWWNPISKSVLTKKPLCSILDIANSNKKKMGNKAP